MTTDKTTSAVAETFKENVDKGIKWFQNANAAFIETQNKQIKVANELYNKAINSIQADGKANVDFGVSGKTIIDEMQKNAETLSNISKAAMKKIAELGKQGDMGAVSKDVKEVFDVYNKQVEELTKLNQQSFDTIVKQFDITKSSFSPLTGNFKKELDANLDSSKQSIEAITKSYADFAVSAVEANKEILDKLIVQVNAGITANIKAWKDLLSIPVATKETEQSVNEPAKASLNGSLTTKKQGVGSN